MSLSSTTAAPLGSVSVIPLPLEPQSCEREDFIRRELAALRSWFGVEFGIFDGATGDVIETAAGQPNADIPLRSALCLAVAARRKVEIIEDEEPLLTLAVPLTRAGNDSLVAVATFLTRLPASHEELVGLAGWFADSFAATERWVKRQTPVAAETLLRIANLYLSQRGQEQRIVGLQGEVEKLSVHLAAMYEEISLIYRLTQNLKISRKEQDLGKLALQWLVDIMPFEGMAMQLLRRHETGQPQPEDRPAALLLTHGHCPIDDGEFTRLLTELGLHTQPRPVVVNRSVTEDACWRFPKIHELIIVPVGEEENLCGWLAAFNHTEGGEFGTVEGDLLCSVSAILGIHSGNAELYRQQAEVLSGIVRALTSAIDAKDPYTCGHSDRVARVAVRLAQAMGCDEQTVETIYLSGLLHDVGKIGINDQVLQKPGKLTPLEFEHIKTHARIGYNILIDLKQLGQVLPVVLHHHESWDGRGYPEGLAGEAIPELARIVAVADAYDAMGSDRPYREGMPDEKLDEVIRQGAGKQWDPRVVEAFFKARDDIRRMTRRESEGGPEVIHYV